MKCLQILQSNVTCGFYEKITCDWWSWSYIYDFFFFFYYIYTYKQGGLTVLLWQFTNSKKKYTWWELVGVGEPPSVHLVKITVIGEIGLLHRNNYGK